MVGLLAPRTGIARDFLGPNGILRYGMVRDLSDRVATDSLIRSILGLDIRLSFILCHLPAQTHLTDLRSYH